MFGAYQKFILTDAIENKISNILYPFCMYADIVFPLKLSPLTYKVPEKAPHDLKGRIVKAPLMGKSLYGIVVEVKDELQIRQEKNIKEIQSIHQYLFSELHLSFLKWLSDYYLTPMGVAIKSCFFEDVARLIDKEDLNSKWVKDLKNSNSQIPESLNSDISVIYNNIKNKSYKSFLFHSSSADDEYSLIYEVFNKFISEIHGAIILVPEIGHIERLASMLKNMLGQRLCFLHSKLSKAKRIETIKRIISGEADIIVGTRSAIFAPLKMVSFIAVFEEHSPSYKAEEGLRYNARDVSVMRGFIEKSCVLLSSVCPSLESIYNAKIGKYVPLCRRQESKIERPKIKIVDMNNYKRNALTISPDVLKEAKQIKSKEGSFLFLVNRKGYSLIKCEDCGHIIHCKKCNVPLVFYKGKNIIRCHYCGYEGAVQSFCEECKGFVIKPYGAGAEKIKEEIEKILNEEALLIQKGQAAYPLPLDADVTSFVIGTAYATRKLKAVKLDAIAIFNADSFIFRPDFRAYERAFQDFIQLSEMVKPEGDIFLQTWSPKNRIFRFIKHYDFHNFYENELSQRKELNYPPFYKIMLLNIFVKTDVQNFLYEIQKMIGDINIRQLDILGPVEIPSALKSYKRCIQILIRSKNKRLINDAAKRILSELQKIKSARVIVDVDPLRV